MNLSAKLSLVMSAVFTSICLGFAITGFTSLAEITDAQQAADAKGFAWFWTFLASVAVVFGSVSWWLYRKQNDDG